MMHKVEMDEEMQAFANSVLESIRQAKRGEGRVTTPEQIAARRAAHPGSAPAGAAGTNNDSF